MKTKMKTKKLAINKETIANLERIMFNSVKGGTGTTLLNTCNGQYACTSHDVDPRCPFHNPPGRE